MATLAQPEKREALLRVRCTVHDHGRWQRLADDHDMTLSAMVRDLLDGLPPKPRRQMPRADPHLLRQVAMVGSNMNQIARAVNAAHVAEAQAFAGDILTELAIIERQLRQLVDEAATR